MEVKHTQRLLCFKKSRSKLKVQKMEVANGGPPKKGRSNLKVKKGVQHEHGGQNKPKYWF